MHIFQINKQQVAKKLSYIVSTNKINTETIQCFVNHNSSYVTYECIKSSSKNLKRIILTEDFYSI